MSKKAITTRNALSFKQLYFFLINWKFSKQYKNKDLQTFIIQTGMCSFLYWINTIMA
jgi:hypothetical protein